MGSSTASLFVLVTLAAFVVSESGSDLDADVGGSRAAQRSILSNIRIQNLKYTSCGPSDVVKVNEVTITPDLKLTASVNVLKNLTGPLSVDLEVKKQFPFLGWTRIPCKGKFGSCSFSDVCSMIPKVALEQCPAKMEELGLDLPCSCPVEARTYTVTDFQLGGRQRSLSSFITSGSFNVRAIVKANGKQIGCHNIAATLA